MEQTEFMAAQEAALARFGVEAESRFVPVPIVDGHAHVLEVGSGPDVLMVNGIGLPAAFWAPLLAEVSGYRIHAVEMPGFGLTDTTPRFAADDLRADATRFLREVIDGLGLGPATIIANSLGSTWSNWLALDHPTEVHAMVHVACPAILLGTSAPVPMRLLSTRGLGALMLRLQPPSAGQVEQLATMVGEDLASRPELRDLLVETERLPEYPRVFRTMLSSLVRIRGPRPSAVVGEDDLRRIAQPVQLIWGDHDPFGSVAVGEAATAALPDAELHVVEGGHAPWLDSPADVAHHAMAFLDRVVGTSAPRTPSG